jgi:hypothetical protein
MRKFSLRCNTGACLHSDTRTDKTSSPVLEETPPPFTVKHVLKLSRNIFVIQCTLRKNKLLNSSRNMVILRQQEELTLVNAVRLNREGEELLQRLGFVARVLRLGTAMGVEHDLHYKNNHGAQVWAPGVSPLHPALVDRLFDEDSLLPISCSRAFVFHNASELEAAILIEPMGNPSAGILLTSDALQSQRHNDLLTTSSRTLMSLAGMMESTVVVPPKWLKSQHHKLPLRDDFDRLLRLQFTRLISAKGAVVLRRAKEETVLAVELAFPIW